MCSSHRHAAAGVGSVQLRLQRPAHRTFASIGPESLRRHDVTAEDWLQGHFEKGGGSARGVAPRVKRRGGEERVATTDEDAEMPSRELFARFASRFYTGTLGPTLRTMSRTLLLLFCHAPKPGQTRSPSPLPPKK